MSTLQRLTDVGLVYEGLDNKELAILSYHCQQKYFIARPSQDPKTTSFLGSARTPTVSFSIDLLLPPGTHEWVVMAHRGMPGPAVEDFYAIFPNLDQALTAVIDFHLGSAQNIGGWQVPLHRHPELTGRDTEAVVVIRGARPLTKTALQQLQTQYRTTTDEARETLFHLWHSRHPEPQQHRVTYAVWQRVYAAQFMCIDHQDMPDQKLYLRRDLGEAYIVVDSDDPLRV